MVSISHDEINLRRLLVRCEEKQRTSNVDQWTISEKQKFAAFVRYAQHLQAKTRIPGCAPRVDNLAKWVDDNQMATEINKGIAEAQSTKEQLLVGLRRLHQVEPDWLHEEQKIPSVELHSADLEEEDEQGEKEKEESEELDRVKRIQNKDNPLESELRKRYGSTRQEETSNIEHVLQHHRQMHDELTNELSRMAQQLKFNSQTFGDYLKKDDKILREAQDAVAKNLENLKRERHRLDEHYNKSWGTSWMTMGVVLFVCIVFILVFLTIKVFGKAK